MYIKRFEVTYWKISHYAGVRGNIHKNHSDFQFCVRMFSKWLGHGTHGVKMQLKSQLTKVSVTQICSMQKYCSDFSDKEHPLVWTPSPRCKGSGTLLAYLRGKQNQACRSIQHNIICGISYFFFSHVFSLTPLPAFEEKHLSLCS